MLRFLEKNLHTHQLQLLDIDIIDIEQHFPQIIMGKLVL